VLENRYFFNLPVIAGESDQKVGWAGKNPFVFRAFGGFNRPREALFSFIFPNTQAPQKKTNRLLTRYVLGD
jgi:hypothetical protein